MEMVASGRLRIRTRLLSHPSSAHQLAHRTTPGKNASIVEKKGHFYRACPEPDQPWRDDRIAAMRKRFETKNGAAEGNRVYELGGKARTADDDEDFEDPKPENE